MAERETGDGASKRRENLKEKIRALRKNLERAYKESAAVDRKLVEEWSALNDPWPDV
jgi:hypothetical protein